MSRMKKMPWVLALLTAMVVYLMAGCLAGETEPDALIVTATPEPTASPATLRQNAKVNQVSRITTSEPTRTPRAPKDGIMPRWVDAYTESRGAREFLWYEGPDCPSETYDIFERVYKIKYGAH